MSAYLFQHSELVYLTSATNPVREVNYATEIIAAEMYHLYSIAIYNEVILFACNTFCIHWLTQLFSQK
jgi:hypothetical protein